MCFFSFFNSFKSKIGSSHFYTFVCLRSYFGLFFGLDIYINIFCPNFLKAFLEVTFVCKICDTFMKKAVSVTDIEIKSYLFLFWIQKYLLYMLRVFTKYERAIEEKSYLCTFFCSAWFHTCSKCLHHHFTTLKYHDLMGQYFFLYFKAFDIKWYCVSDRCLKTNCHDIFSCLPFVS